MKIFFLIGLIVVLVGGTSATLSYKRQPILKYLLQYKLSMLKHLGLHGKHHDEHYHHYYAHPYPYAQPFPYHAVDHVAGPGPIPLTGPGPLYGALPLHSGPGNTLAHSHFSLYSPAFGANFKYNHYWGVPQY